MSGIGDHQPRRHIERGGLSGTVGSQQSYNLSLTHVDAHAVGHRTLAVNLHQAFRTQHHALAVVVRLAHVRSLFRLQI